MTPPQQNTGTPATPYRPGDPVRVLVLDPESGGTVLAPATVEHCDPTTWTRWPWRVTYRLNEVQAGVAFCDGTGEGDYIVPATRHRPERRDLAPDEGWSL